MEPGAAGPPRGTYATRRCSINGQIVSIRQNCTSSQAAHRFVGPAITTRPPGTSVRRLVSRPIAYSWPTPPENLRLAMPNRNRLQHEQTQFPHQLTFCNLHAWKHEFPSPSIVYNILIPLLPRTFSTRPVGRLCCRAALIVGLASSAGVTVRSHSLLNSLPRQIGVTGHPIPDNR